MNKEHIPVITDREELYDKCENMEQLYDKYYLPLLDIHYRKTYELQQENQELKSQLEEYKRLGFKHLNAKCTKLENQQKEFIEYLESYLKIFDKKDIDMEGYYDCIEEILSKYKEIIGDDR